MLPCNKYTTEAPGQQSESHPHSEHSMDYNNNNPYLQLAPVPPAATNGHGTNGNSKSDLLSFEFMNAFMAFVNLNYLYHIPVCFLSGSMGKICEALNRCGKRVEVATKKAVVYADNIWHHCEFFFSLFMLPPTRH